MSIFLLFGKYYFRCNMCWGDQEKISQAKMQCRKIKKKHFTNLKMNLGTKKYAQLIFIVMQYYSNITVNVTEDRKQYKMTRKLYRMA